MSSLSCCVGTRCCTLDQQKKLLEEGENNVTVVQPRRKNKGVLQRHNVCRMSDQDLTSSSDGSSQ